ncbi:MAG: DUF2852 domain-containing protein [Alphaproteobacteria bacterium]|nr:DUF2852 domain-containing protein [Alphaproteobacteria bacterium]
MHSRTGGFEQHGQNGRRRRKGVWTPLSVGLMVVGFVVFWPLGLAVLAYNIWAQPGDFQRWLHRYVRPEVNAARESDSRIAAIWRGFENDIGSLLYEMREGWRRWQRRRQD